MLIGHDQLIISFVRCTFRLKRSTLMGPLDGFMKGLRARDASLNILNTPLVMNYTPRTYIPFIYEYIYATLQILNYSWLRHYSLSPQLDCTTCTGDAFEFYKWTLGEHQLIRISYPRYHIIIDKYTFSWEEERIQSGTPISLATLQSHTSFYATRYCNFAREPPTAGCCSAVIFPSEIPSAIQISNHSTLTMIGGREKKPDEITILNMTRRGLKSSSDYRTACVFGGNDLSTCCFNVVVVASVSTHHPRLWALGR